MERKVVAGIRIPAFIIDFTLVISLMLIINKILILSEIVQEKPSIELIMFVIIPLGFFLNWITGLNLGKRILKIEIIDEKTEGKPSLWQYFVRSLLFMFVISLNIIFIIPMFVSKKKRAFHDMMAGTLVVKKKPHEDTSGD